MDAEQHRAKAPGPAWLHGELDGDHFFDARLARRLQELAGQLWEHRGQSIPMACQDWANTKAAVPKPAALHQSVSVVDVSGRDS
ncbi:transposase DNA-binding-containing protein [Herbaspirillum sp. GCM10030257]|uniref:IS4/Tn5 family transposase DNA-binding protein n=1 Tax=Herbaspirillum sp. GCM10030257 TaxID=3273393 RepID=UPI00361C29C8